MKLKKIVIAPDSFKGCLSAAEVAESCKAGVLRVFPEAETVLMPMADGGEGTVEALAPFIKGEYVDCKVSDPLGRIVEARYLLSQNKHMAVIETASAAGLTLLDDCERNPWITTTYGLGEMIKDALDKGCSTICVGLGGSATNDGGSGMLSALGCRFLDSDGNELEGKGMNLHKIESIDVDSLDKRLITTRFVVACDVDNPFYGENGAAAVFAPQKGAAPEIVAALDSGMRHFACVVNNATGNDISMLRGSGAAGGLGGAFASFFNSELVPGIDMVLEASGFDEKIKGADLVLTGEGSIDAQSLMGKVLSGVFRRSAKSGVPVVAIAGRVSDVEELNDAGICAVFSIQPGAISISDAMNGENARRNIERTVEQLMSILDLK